MSRKKKTKKTTKNLDGGHTIPTLPPPSGINQGIMNRSEYEESAIRQYVETQAPGEKVIYLEKVVTERLYGRQLDGWDVHTKRERYWVIINPTNLYSQKVFPSLDYTITFHIGLTARIMARREKDESHDRLTSAWQSWLQSAEALDLADEAVEFQAVGMLCRECLIALILAIADESMIPEGQEAPQKANFIKWSELIADKIAQGPHAQEIRGYLKTIAKSTWQLVNWLTHSSNAVRFDARIAVDATENILASYGTALLRYESGTPNRCPNCGSYQLVSVYRSDLEIDPPFITTCKRCGWVIPNFENSG